MKFPSSKIFSIISNMKFKFSSMFTILLEPANLSVLFDEKILRSNILKGHSNGRDIFMIESIRGWRRNFRNRYFLILSDMKWKVSFATFGILLKQNFPVLLVEKKCSNVVY